MATVEVRHPEFGVGSVKAGKCRHACGSKSRLIGDICLSLIAEIGDLGLRVGVLVAKTLHRFTVVCDAKEAPHGNSPV